jgi:hypothetical protein
VLGANPVARKGGWVQYEVLFLWKGKPIVNNALLKRRGKYWRARSKGAFKANEYRHDTLIPTLERVLETNKPEYWEPIEPDTVMAFYPDTYFPFMKSHYRVVWEKEAIKRARERRKQAKAKAGGKLPDDPITVIACVDAYNLDDADAYYGEGIAQIMCPTRKELEAFCKQLKREYAVFKRRYKVDEYKEE